MALPPNQHRKDYMERSRFERRPDSTPMRRLGRKGLEWVRVRRQLKCEFRGLGITTCELGLPGCMVDNGLGFAHALKRRHVATLADLRRVALLCNNCHDTLELNGEAKMCRIIDSLIAKRAT